MAHRPLQSPGLTSVRRWPARILAIVLVLAQAALVPAASADMPATRDDLPVVDRTDVPMKPVQDAKAPGDAERGPPEPRPEVPLKADFFRRGVPDLRCSDVMALSGSPTVATGCSPLPCSGTGLEPAAACPPDTCAVVVTQACREGGCEVCAATAALEAPAPASPGPNPMPAGFFVRAESADGSAAAPEVGKPFEVDVVLYAFEDLEGLALSVAPTPGVTVTPAGLALPARLAKGEHLQLEGEVLPVAAGPSSVLFTVSFVAEGLARQLAHGVAFDLVPGEPARVTAPEIPDGMRATPPMESTSSSSSFGVTALDYRANPVVFVHGIDAFWESGGNVEPFFGDFINAFVGWGWNPSKLYAAGYYECDTGDAGIVATYLDLSLHGKPKPAGSGSSWTVHDGYVADADVGFGEGNEHDGDNCGAVNGHSANAAIGHLAYHLAWSLNNTFGPGTPAGGAAGVCVDIVAQSMGGLITRHALQRVMDKHAEFPSSLCVEDVVTLNSPHAGKLAWEACDWYDQCDEMEFDSDFTNWQEDHAQNPQVGPGTDWMLIGSEGDLVVDEFSATGQDYDNMAPAHWAIYEAGFGMEDLNHNEIMEFTDPEPSSDYKVRSWDATWGTARSGGDPVEPAPSPGRYSDMASAYGVWGCGGNTNDSAWYIPYDTAVTAQPYSSSWMCVYLVEVPSGTPRLVVQVNSPSGANRDLVVRQGSVTGTVRCSVATAGPTEQCNIASPAAGKYYVLVPNAGGSTDPYTVLVTQSVPSRITGLTITSAPTSVTPGATYSVCWNIAGGGSATTSVRWGTAARSYPRATPDQSGSVPGSYCASLTAPSSRTTVRLVAVAENAYETRSSAEWSIAVQAPDDCGAGADAGGTSASAYGVATPLWGCLAGFATPDAQDWYSFTVTTGRPWAVRIVPNPRADFSLCVYNPSGAAVGCSSAGVGLMDTVTIASPVAGTYRAKVATVSGDGGYTMSVTPTPNDCATGADAANTHAGASALTLPAVSCTADMPSGDPDDYYRFNANAGDFIQVTLQPNAYADFDLCVYNPAGTAVRCSGAGTGATEMVGVAASSSGQWRIRVAAYAGTGPYRLWAALTPQDDCHRRVDAPSSGTPTLLVPPITGCPASMPSGDTADMYRVDTPAGAILTVHLSPNTGADFDVCIANPSGTPVQCSVEPGSYTEHLQVTVPTAGFWRIHVTKYAGDGPYTLSVSITIPPNDCSTRTDAGNTRADATAVAVPFTNCKGALPAGDAEDWFKFELKPGVTLTAIMTPNAQADFDLCVYDPWGSGSCSTGASNSRESVTRTLAAAGTWSIRVLRYAGSGSYQLTAQVGPPPSDCGTGGDAGDTFAAASSPAMPISSCNAYLPSGDTDDYYRATVSAGGKLQVGMTPGPGADFDLCIYGPSGGTALACGYSGGSATETLTVTATTTGAHRFRVTAVSGSGIYSMMARIVPPPNDCGTGVDAGDTSAGSVAIAVPVGPCNGAVGGQDAGDWFHFGGGAGSTVTVTLRPAAGTDFDLCLYNPSGASVACSTAGTGQTDAVQVTLPSAGTWKVQVHPYSGSGSYTLRVAVAGPNDCGVGGDASNTEAGAPAIAMPSSCSGFLPLGDSDWFRFPATGGTTLRAVVTPLDWFDADACLVDPTGNVVACSTGGGASQETIAYQVPASGTYRLRIYAYAGAGDYSLSLTAVMPGDCGLSGDAGNSLSSASTISPASTPCNGILTGTDGSDYYQVHVPASGSTIQVTLDPPAGADFDVCLYNPSGNRMACSSNWGSDPDFISFTGGAPGYWKIWVDQYSGTGQYSLTLTVTAPPSNGDCGTFADGANTQAYAAALALPVAGCQGTMSSGDTVDWFRFSKSSGSGITVSMTPNSGADFDVCLYNPSGTSVGCSLLGGSSTDSVSVTASSTGDWAVKVFVYSGTGSYSLSVS